MIQVVLNNATLETDNPDLRDRAYIYWRLLSTDPEAAKDVVLAEKPVISDDSNQFDSSLLSELLANIATLSSVYHKTPETFVTRVRTIPKTEEEELPEGFSNTPRAHILNGAPSPTTIPVSPYALTKQTSLPPASIPDLLDLGLDVDVGNSNAMVPVDSPSAPTGPPLPILLPAANGQGLQISAQLVRRDGKVFYSLILENNTQNSLDGFMIQFNKNTFGLAAGGPLQVPELLPGTTRKALLPMVLFQNMAPGSPTSLLQVAVKNNQQPVWYFNDRISLFVLFTEDGKMERDIFLETWRSLPDSNEVSKEIRGILINNVDATIEELASSNMFFIAKRKKKNQEVLYLSAKLPRGIPLLIELTAVLGSPGVKCALKTPSPEMAPLFFEALETLLQA
ncbi:unnamed protein product [Lactuca virosa]|uniref:Beta-adaptin-like protein n=1 Tax=Lactuca virosa TaxID=75947 RepID=A0AAU9LPM5_9ASTR|nr:unnamed protein product [Lactuca virosa]